MAKLAETDGLKGALVSIEAIATNALPLTWIRSPDGFASPER